MTQQRAEYQHQRTKGYQEKNEEMGGGGLEFLC